MSIIGIITISWYKQYAIMMVRLELTAERVEGKNTLDSIIEASVPRFPQILTTTMAATFGTMSSTVGIGTVSKLRRLLDILIIGGWLARPKLTLCTTQGIYLFM